MADNSFENLRGRAAHCRNLAKSVADEATRQTLLKMADELDEQATAVEVPNQPPSPPIC
jgi:hypothetical protein